MCPGLWQKKQIGRWRGYGCCLGADHDGDGKSREACVFLRAFWISFETSTSSLDPTSFWNTCCRAGWLVMDLVCLKMVLYLPSLGSPLARQLSMRSSNAATAAYGSNSAGGVIPAVLRDRGSPRHLGWRLSVWGHLSLLLAYESARRKKENKRVTLMYNSLGNTKEIYAILFLA